MKKIIKKQLWKKNKNLITRFAPELNWNLHIGHLKNIIINSQNSKIYNGMTNIRIDDTNSKKNKFIYLNNLKKNLKWFIKNNDKNINYNILYTSKYFYKLYQYKELLIKKKIELKILNRNTLKLIRNFRKGFYKEKKKITKILKNKKIYRIIYNKHYKLKYNWFIYPCYDYSHNISDKIENIIYSICTEEFKKNKSIYNIIINLFFNNKKKTNQIEVKNFMLKNNILSKSILKKIIKNKYIKNSKDIKLKTLNSFIKNNIKFNYIELILKNNIKLIKKKNKKKKHIIINIKNISKKKIKKIKKNLILTKNIIILKKKINKKNKIFKKIFLLKKTNYQLIYYKKKWIIRNKNKNKKIYKNLNLKWINKYFKNEFIKILLKNLFKNKLKINSNNEKIKIISGKKNNKKIGKKKNKKFKKNKIKIKPSSLYDLNV
ncbi:glutamate--tRNA ligase family protein [Candidatus Nasuia deltocephalinicola]|uniref:glutamate--tRNA ligase family protein n=1 Tax=Candidatus Nasuia deltocephalincola TaxID=1160784 RepID=UPI00216B1EF9|nr:glutamate--tRNA ligase family protein [Candidatus Nasuia deltocephalinicola]